MVNNETNAGSYSTGKNKCDWIIFQTVIERLIKEIIEKFVKIVVEFRIVK